MPQCWRWFLVQSFYLFWAILCFAVLVKECCGGADMTFGTHPCKWHGQSNRAVLAESLYQHLWSQICPEPLYLLPCHANGCPWWTLAATCWTLQPEGCAFCRKAMFHIHRVSLWGPQLCGHLAWFAAGCCGDSVPECWDVPWLGWTWWFWSRFCLESHQRRWGCPNIWRSLPFSSECYQCACCEVGQFNLGLADGKLLFCSG